MGSEEFAEARVRSPHPATKALVAAPSATTASTRKAVPWRIWLIVSLVRLFTVRAALNDSKRPRKRRRTKQLPDGGVVACAGASHARSNHNGIADLPRFDLLDHVIAGLVEG